MFMYKHLFFAFVLVIFSMFYMGCEQGVEPTGENQGTMQFSPSSNLLWPAGATLNSATLSVFSNLATEDAVVEVFVLTTDWTENGVNWTWADSGNVLWTTPGGDLGVKVGEFNVVTGFVGWYHVDIANAVNYWISGGDNFGILLKQSTGNTTYHSSEYGNVSQRPKITLDYTADGVNTIAVIQRGTNEDVFDSWFYQVNPLINHGEDGTLVTRLFVVNGEVKEKRTVIKFPFEVEYVPPPECETAFAYGNDFAACFILWEEFSNWGWTNGQIQDAGVYTWDIYAGAGQCDLSKGTVVGTLTLDYDGVSTAQVTYSMDPGFTMSETHLYIGSDPFPSDKNGFTNAPGKYSFIHDDLSAATTDSYTVSVSGDFYIIAHAVVCGDF
jgi:hypothetical protein